jgi:hypothetical protein
MPRRSLPNDAMWTCANCGKQERATVHKMRYRTCSRACADAVAVPSSHQNRQEQERKKLAASAAECIARGMSGRAAAQELGIAPSRLALICGEFGLTFRKPRPTATCAHCGTVFPYSPSNHRRFCTYTCFVASGGPVEAGYAARRAMKKYGAKKDANHKEIMAALKSMVPVHDLSAMGCGVPDGIAWINEGWQLFDIKNPKTGYGKRGLNERQKTWADKWDGGPVYLIYSEDEARAFARGEFSAVKRFPERLTG